MTLRSRALALLLFVASGCATGPSEVSRIVVVTFDTTRADRLGCYGDERARTPHLDRLAAEGVLFEQAVSSNPTTLSSHSTMFTGFYPQDHGVRYNVIFRLGPEAHTLAEALQEAGYATAAFPASFILDRIYGLDQGFDTYVQPPTPEGSTGSREVMAVRRSAGEGVDRALSWLREHDGEERLFVWLHFYDPHYPYAPPFPYSSEFRGRPYDGEIAYADAQFGRLMGHLREHPRWDETLVVVAGDHGEGLYDHGESYHSLLVYETTQRVPLIIRAPGVRAARVDDPVALADLMPTVLDLAGQEPPAGLRGISLEPALRGERLPRRSLYFETLTGALNYGWSQLRGVRTGRYKLIDASDPELFDIEEDPEETRNLAADQPDLLQEMRAELRKLTETDEDAGGASPAHEAVPDRETERLLVSLGYVAGSSSWRSAEGAPHPREVIDLEAVLLNAGDLVVAEDWEAVEPIARSVLARDPTNKWGLQKLAVALSDRDAVEEAQDAASEMLRLYPEEPTSYVTLASTYKVGGVPERAYAVLKQGHAALPDSEMLAYFLLVAAFDAGRASVCHEELPPIRERYPRSWRMLVLEARCEVRRGDDAAALAALGAALDAGFGSPRMLEEVEEFERLVRSPGFQELLERQEREERAAASPPQADRRPSGGSR